MRGEQAKSGCVVAEMYCTVDSIFGGYFSTNGRLYSHVE